MQVTTLCRVDLAEQTAVHQSSLTSRTDVDPHAALGLSALGETVQAGACGDRMKQLTIENLPCKTLYVFFFSRRFIPDVVTADRIVMEEEYKSQSQDW